LVSYLTCRLYIIRLQRCCAISLLKIYILSLGTNYYCEKTRLGLFPVFLYFHGINNLSDGVSSGALDKCCSRHSIFKRQFRRDSCNIPFYIVCASHFRVKNVSFLVYYCTYMHRTFWVRFFSLIHLCSARITIVIRKSNTYIHNIILYYMDMENMDGTRTTGLWTTFSIIYR